MECVVEIVSPDSDKQRTKATNQSSRLLLELLAPGGLAGEIQSQDPKAKEDHRAWW